MVPGCFLGRPFCASKQGLRAPGSELLGQKNGPRRDMQMTGFIVASGFRCGLLRWRKANVAVQLLQCNFPKIAAQLLPGRIYIRPPPPYPISGHEAFFRGGGWGCIYFEAPRGRNFIRPPLYTPPTPRRVFSGVGGWACIKFGPVLLFSLVTCCRGGV